MFFVNVAAVLGGTNIQSANDFWLFVVYCVVVIVVVIFFLFYFNRVLGQILTFLVNQYTWRTYNAYLEVGNVVNVEPPGFFNKLLCRLHSSFFTWWQNSI